MVALAGAGGGGTVTPAATLLLASWVEAAFYGIYTALFIQYMMTRYEYGIGKVLSGRVHFVVTIFMYLNGTACSVLSIFKTLVKLKAIDGHPDSSASEEAEFAAATMTFAQVVLGDFLTTYRTHTVWNGDWRVSSLPWLMVLANFVLLFTSSVSHCDPPQISASLFIAVAQNILTTGLVVYRLGMQHSESSRANLHRFSRRNGALIRIAYIISESAAVYLAALVLYTVFYHIKHPGLLYMELILSSVIGIVLLVISVRVAGMKSGSAGAGGPSMTWATPTEWRISVQFAPPVDSSGSAHEDTQAEGVPYEAEIQLPRAGSKEGTK